ncbi:SDR family oxidoreductase [Pseudomonas profundi]|uniref:SDR family oxidoreductase n=1 Tax=Pseudomonas profundi TaxID=1981513 RepID=UPI00123BE8C0|nr:SDR family oxidoreductase [Pseudomonas profundi]
MACTIEGKVIIITGASSGIGEAAARLLAARGAKVVLGARRIERLEALVAEITAAGTEASGGEAVCQATDVTSATQVQALVDLALERYGRVDVMINNAGLMAIASIHKVRVEEWERMVDINIKGVLYGIAAALPVFQKQKVGHFINVGSIASHKVAPGGAVYSGTKFAVRAISEGLRQEGGAIRCTMISPGGVKTELPKGSSDQTTVATLEEMYRTALPAETIARAMAYAIEQPPEVDVNEIVIRPAAQAF